MKTGEVIFFMYPKVTALSFRLMCTCIGNLSLFLYYSTLFFIIFIYYAFKQYCN
jgi:hypothetical protein